jgi:hypothetical protein
MGALSRYNDVVKNLNAGPALKPWRCARTRSCSRLKRRRLSLGTSKPVLIRILLFWINFVAVGLLRDHLPPSRALAGCAFEFRHVEHPVLFGSHITYVSVCVSRVLHVSVHRHKRKQGLPVPYVGVSEISFFYPGLRK